MRFLRLTIPFNDFFTFLKLTRTTMYCFLSFSIGSSWYKRILLIQLSRIWVITHDWKLSIISKKDGRHKASLRPRSFRHISSSMKIVLPDEISKDVVAKWKTVFQLQRHKVETSKKKKRQLLPTNARFACRDEAPARAISSERILRWISMKSGATWFGTQTAYFSRKVKSFIKESF